MVHTRGQKAKEERETKLAEQHSLLEQSQSVSVPSQLNDELEATFASQRDTIQLAISQPNISKHDSGEQITAEQTIAEQGVTTDDVGQAIAKLEITEQILVERNGNINEKAVAKQAILMLNTVEQNATGQTLAEQAAVERLVVKPENNIATNVQKRYGLRERSKTSIGGKVCLRSCRQLLY
jgi:hypothetical protein